MGFWICARRSGRSIPGAGCDACDNEGQSQKTCRLKGFRGNGRLASLLLSRRPTRGMGFPSPANQFPKLSCALSRKAVSFVTPRHTTPAMKTAPLPIFRQALKPFSEKLFSGHGFAGGIASFRQHNQLDLLWTSSSTARNVNRNSPWTARGRVLRSIARPARRKL